MTPMLVKTRQAQDMKMKKNKKCSFQVNFFFISIKLILISFFFYGGGGGNAALLSGAFSAKAT